MSKRRNNSDEDNETSDQDKIYTRDIDNEQIDNEESDDEESNNDRSTNGEQDNRGSDNEEHETEEQTITEEAKLRYKKAELIKKKIELIAKKKMELEKQRNVVEKKLKLEQENNNSDEETEYKSSVMTLNNNYVAPKIDRELESHIKLQQSREVRTSRFQPNRQKIGAVTNMRIVEEAAKIADQQRKEQARSSGKSSKTLSTTDKNISKATVIPYIPIKRVGGAKIVSEKKSDMVPTETVINKPVQRNIAKPLVINKSLDKLFTYNIISDTCKKTFSPVITKINVEKGSNGLKIIIDLDPDTIKHPVYTINYISDREKLLASIHKRDNLKTITRTIDNANISLITDSKLILNVIDLYTDSQSIIIQEIVIESSSFGNNVLTSHTQNTTTTISHPTTFTVGESAPPLPQPKNINPLAYVKQLNSAIKLNMKHDYDRNPCKPYMVADEQHKPLQGHNTSTRVLVKR